MPHGANWTTRRIAIVGLADRIKPIAAFEAEALEIVRELNEGGEPVILTVNGEARAVVVDIRAWEAEQEALALLKLLAMSGADHAAGRSRDAEEVFDELLSGLE
jgi:prevent-host-death family protein